MSIFKNKMLLLSPIVALIIVFIFAVALIPSAKQAPKNLPIAIVNSDKGVDLPNNVHLNMGKTIAENIENSSKATTGDNEPALKWIAVSNIDDMKAGLNDQKYYGALVIPTDFSEKQASLQTPTPSSPEVQIYVNQGKNAMASNVVTQMLNGIVDGINKNTSVQLLDGFKNQGNTLTIEQASILISPITKTVFNLNEIGQLGSAPVSLFQPLWMASLAGAVIIWLAMRKLEPSMREKRIVIKSAQVVMGAIVALIAGFGLTWFAEGMLGFAIPQFMDTALFLSITSFSFILMIIAILAWLGLGGIPIFVLLLFFGAPLLALAPEFMPSFYHDWVFSWLPMRFMVDGLRELFFFSKSLSWNHPTSVLIWIGLGSIILFYLSVLKPDSEKESLTTKQVAK